MSLVPWNPRGNVESYVLEGVTRHRLPFPATIGRQRGQAQTNTTTFLNGVSITDTVPAPPGTVSLEGRAAREFTAHRIVREQLAERGSVVVEVEAGAPRTRLEGSAGMTVAITPAGVLTVAGINLMSSLDFVPGIGIIHNNVLYILQSVSGATGGVVTRHGAVSGGISTRDAEAIPTVAASSDFSVVEYAEITSYQGTVNTAGAEQVDANRARTATMEFQLQQDEGIERLRVPS